MTTFVVGLPLASFYCLKMSIFFRFHLHALSRLLSHLFCDWCIIFRWRRLCCQRCSQVVTFHAINKLCGNAKASPVNRFLWIATSSQALQIIQKLINDSSSLCLLFANLILASCPFNPEPKRFNSISKILSSVSRSSSFLPCPPDCLVLLCKPVFHHSGCPAQDVVLLTQPSYLRNHLSRL